MNLDYLGLLFFIAVGLGIRYMIVNASSASKYQTPPAREKEEDGTQAREKEENGTQELDSLAIRGAGEALEKAGQKRNKALFIWLAEVIVGALISYALVSEGIESVESVIFAALIYIAVSIYVIWLIYSANENEKEAGKALKRSVRAK